MIDYKIINIDDNTYNWGQRKNSEKWAWQDRYGNVLCEKYDDFGDYLLKKFEEIIKEHLNDGWVANNDRQLKYDNFSRLRGVSISLTRKIENDSNKRSRLDL